MTSIIIAGDVSGTVALLAPDASGTSVLTLPVATGTLLASVAVTESTTHTNTNKIEVNIGGVTYYLLASTSAT
jgi:hypothetical protein